MMMMIPLLLSMASLWEFFLLTVGWSDWKSFTQSSVFGGEVVELETLNKPPITCYLEDNRGPTRSTTLLSNNKHFVLVVFYMFSFKLSLLI